MQKTNQQSLKARSLQQNKYMWGVVLDKSLEFYSNNESALVLDILDFIKADLTPEFVHELFKMGFNNSKSTAKLGTTGMEEYLLQVRVYMLQRHKLDIAPPNEPPLNELTIGKDYAN